MKKSNILIVSALAFFLCSLTAFNFVMKTEYDKGNYKDPLNNFVKQDFTGFNALEVNGGSLISVKVVQGPFKVFLHNRVLGLVQVRQQGQKLVIDVNLEKKGIWSNGRYVVYVSCPNLKTLNTTSRYTLLGKPHQELASVYPYGLKKVLLEEFKQDSLNIQMDHATAVELFKTNLGKLNAVVGPTPESNSMLLIRKDNQINAADLDIRNQSSLYMFDVVIPSLSYKFSNTAKAEFTGSALTAISKK
ncbi:head GIN domain-containing protein [Rufibacter roseolus]|uniref:hypothetical protein n=1 Tax=Rufibacter roseolus TaxID=2817375 RepID=UPI001B300AB8|nr:hypothetical protein [Rufibacter roseolus]